MTAIEIFNAIDNQSISREAGIKMIENYGMQKSMEGISNMGREMGYENDQHDKHILELVDRMNKQLDALIRSTVECYPVKKGKK